MTSSDFFYHFHKPYNQYLHSGFVHPAPPKGYVIIGGKRNPRIVAIGEDPYGLDRPPIYIYRNFYTKVLGEEEQKKMASWQIREMAIRDHLSVYMLKDDFFKRVEALLNSGDEETAFFDIWEAYKREYISSKIVYNPDRTIWAVKVPKHSIL